MRSSRTYYDKAAKLERFLLKNYTYDLRVPPLWRSNGVVDSFLFERHTGFCAQFATTMAVMERLVDLPARVVTGYVPGSYNSLTGVHVVRLQDAHAWVEIKFRRYGWVPFGPTPRPDSPWRWTRGSYRPQGACSRCSEVGSRTCSAPARLWHRKR